MIRTTFHSRPVNCPLPFAVAPEIGGNVRLAVRCDNSRDDTAGAIW